MKINAGTKKQLEIYDLIEKGYTYKQLVKDKGFSPRTAKKYIASYSPNEYKQLKAAYESHENKKTIHNVTNVTNVTKKQRGISKIHTLNYDEIVKLSDQGLTRQEVSEKLNVSLATLDRFLKMKREETGVRLFKYKKEIDIARVSALKSSGMPYTEIAKVLNVSYSKLMRDYASKAKTIDLPQLKIGENISEALEAAQLQIDQEDIKQQDIISEAYEENKESESLPEPEKEDRVDEMSIAHEQAAKDLFEVYEQIFKSFRKMDEIVSNIKVYYTNVGNYNIDQQEVLHKMENATSQNELMQIAEDMFILRKKRRIAKMEYALAYRLMNNLKQYRMHTEAFLGVAKNLEELLEVYKDKNYTPPEHREALPENVSFSTDTFTKKDKAASDDETELQEWQLKLKQITSDK